MKAMIGKKAPHIDATAVVNGNQIVEHFSLDQYVGNKYVVLFFYPLDFTFVCPTELHAFQEKLAEFEKRNVAVVGCSVDSEFSHFAWLQTDKNKGGIHGVTFPIISDLSKTISENYGVLASDYDYDDDGNAISTGYGRGLPRPFPDRQGRQHPPLRNQRPAAGPQCGRSTAHGRRPATLRRVRRGMPANWSKGKDAMEASGKGVADYLSKH